MLSQWQCISAGKEVESTKRWMSQKQGTPFWTQDVAGRPRSSPRHWPGFSQQSEGGSISPVMSSGHEENVQWACMSFHKALQVMSHAMGC